MLTPHRAKPQTSLLNDRFEAISLPLQAGGKDAIGSDRTKIRRESGGPDLLNLIGTGVVRLSSNWFSARFRESSFGIALASPV